MDQHKYISKLSLHISENSHQLTLMEKDMIQKLMCSKSLFTYKNFTIAHISELLNVSSTSLHRLSKKLGYASFALLKEDYFAGESVCQPKQGQKEYETLIMTTISLVKEALSEKLLDSFSKAKRISMYGMGMSSFLTDIYQIKLDLMGITARSFDDSRFMRISARQLNKEEDVIILLSRSGKPPELINVLIEANKREVTSVLISEARNSPLEAMASYVIHVADVQDEDDRIDGRVHTHIALDLLVEAILLKRKTMYEEPI